VLFLYQNDEAGRMPATRMRAGVRFAAFLGRRLITRVTRFSFRLTIKGSRRARHLLIAANIARHPWEYYVRRKAAIVRARDTGGVTISRAAGFARFNESDFAELPDIVRLCQHIYVDEKREMVKAPAKSTTKQKTYLVELLTDEDLVRYPLLVDFCLSRPVVGVVSRYLGTVPVLRRVGLWLSFPAPINGASRLFHLDPEDFRQVRMFVNVIDISKPQGPLTFLPADLSEKVLTQLWRDERRAGIRRPEYRRWTDEEIFARSGSAECFDLAGPEGSGVFLDTARCLHFGSRMEPGTMRLVFHAQFLPYHFAYSCSANRFDRARAGGDVMRSRLLAQRPGMSVIAVGPGAGSEPG
jgi:hypothetical protein